MSLGLPSIRALALAIALPLVAALLLASPVSADDWTLASTLERADASSPEVLRAQAELGVANAHTAYGRIPVVGNPVIGARALVGPDSEAATYTISLGLPIDFSGRASAWRSEATHVVEVATASLDVARVNARHGAFAAYVDVGAAEAALANARDRADSARALVASTEARLRAGAATSLDVALAERELAVAAAAVEESEREVDSAKERFRQALDLDAREGVETEELTRPEMPQGLSIQSVTTRALRNRRESAAWRAQEARFRAAEQRVRRDAIDPVTVAVEGERQGNRGGAYAAGGSLAVPIPIVRTNQGERAVMRGQAELAATETALVSRAIEREAAAAYRELEHLLSELAAIDDAALPAAELSLNLSERLLVSGAVDVFRVLVARNELYAQRRHRIDVLRMAWRAYAALDRAVGGLGQ